MEPLAILFGAAFTVVTAWALGRCLLRRGELALEFLTGAALLSAAVFLLAVVHLVYPAALLLGGAAALAMALRLPVAARPTPARWSLAERLLLIPFAIFFVFYLSHAMAPEASPDGAAYHLGLVSRYFRAHGLVRVTSNLYASLSQGMEMLYLSAFAFGRHSAAAMVHFAFLLALVWLMWSWARRAGHALAGGCAALLVFASPIVGLDGTTAYNDVALAAVAFALFCALEACGERPDARLLAAIGLLAGFAFAIKYTGALAVPYAAGVVAWRTRRSKPVAAVVAGAALMALPWLVKNAVWAGNPLAPFYNRWFPNPWVTVAFEQEYLEYLRRYDLKSLWEIPMQVTTHGSMSGLLGPVFLLAPMALAALSRREGRRLLLAAAVFGGLYFNNIGTRFLIPALPFVALAMMLLPARMPAAAVGLALLHAAISWPSLVPGYSRPEAWRLPVHMPWKAALRIRPADDYLEERCSNYGVDRLIEQVTEPGATIFTYTPIPESYTSRNIRVVYQSAENKTSGAIEWTALVPEYAPTWRLRFDFPRQPLEGLRVVQTGSGSRDLWNIHELRIYNGGRELPRASRWRLTAQPTPWDIQAAFDNSLLTFWMAGEFIRPGQFVRVDFGGAEQADAVVIETAPDQWGIRLQLEAVDRAGRTRLLAAAPKPGSVPAPLGLARAAAQELKRRGIDYILVFDSDIGAKEFATRADAWGISLAGRYRQASLYKIL